MVVRRRRKYRKKLGSRSYHGDTKNRRGKGRKGGRGLAGVWDHKKFGYLDLIRERNRGFKPPRRSILREINVGDLEKLLIETGKKEIELIGYKLLGRGRISLPAKVVVSAATENAIKKIEAAGGQVVIHGSQGA